MPKILFKLLTFLIIIAPLGCLAQFTISGRILNSTNLKPVANANVFINNATIGTASAADGTFNLYNVEPGKYDVVVSIVGFETFSQTITVTNSNVNLHHIMLIPKITSLDEVTIKVKKTHRKNYFDIYYPQFKKEFLGTSVLAYNCNILNPEMLNLEFNDQTNQLTATSSDFLKIDNPDLGYEVKYLLVNFSLNVITRELHYDGPVQFTEMKGTPAQERNWQENRENAYEGSNMHFLRSIIDDKLEGNDFRVYRLAKYANPNRPPDSVITAEIKEKEKEQKLPVEIIRIRGIDLDSLTYWKKKFKEPKILQTLFPYPLNRMELLMPGAEPGLFAFGCDSDKLVIDYEKDLHYIDIKKLQDLVNLNYVVSKPGNKNLSIVELNEPFFFFDANGIITDPNSIKLSGVWAKNRVADLLPVNYQPSKNIVHGPDSVIMNIKNKMDTFSTEHITEKVHIHFDRSWYAAGDTLWFKAYVVAGPNHQLSPISEVLHAELINDKDSVVKRLILQLNQGVCNGDFELPQTYSSGVYRLRAYTNWMLNDSAYFYDQKIIIGGLPPAIMINTSAAKAQAVKQAQKATNNINMQFFPEGGDLIAGLRSKVAFKAIGSNGLAENVSGIIVDEDGNQVAVFQSAHLGMGTFPLTPLADKKYTAKIIAADGTNFNVDLPDAKVEGFTLTVNNTGDSIYVKVAINDFFYKNNQNTSFYLVAQSGGKNYYSAENILTNTVFSTYIEKRRFPSGIVQFTLFSGKGEPLNERIIYVENNDQLKLDISTPKTIYSPREKVKLNIEAKDKEDNTSAGIFSIAVTDETRAPVDEYNEHTILTDLLLTSELKGYVENPGYYFKNVTNQTRDDLDLLMLTQGYRKFNWRKIFAGKEPPIIYEPQTSTSLSGTIKDSRKKPVINQKMRLTALKDHFVTDTTSDINGNFTFDGLNLTDTTKVIISAVNMKDNKNVNIYLNEPVYPAINKATGSINYADTSISPALRDAMLNAYINGLQYRKNTTVLKEVQIKAHRKNPVFQPSFSDNINFSSNLFGPGNAEQVVLTENLPTPGQLDVALLGRMHYVSIYNGIPYLMGKNEPMAIFLEGGLVSADMLVNINSNDVYSIEVLTSDAQSLYGKTGKYGVLVITLKHGTGTTIKLNDPINGLMVYKINGFYKEREFYSPKYDPVQPVPNADNRKTIYWNPDVNTASNGKTSLEYFNADGKGTYRVVVEGIDADGNIGQQVFSYKVE